MGNYNSQRSQHSVWCFRRLFSVGRDTCNCKKPKSKVLSHDMPAWNRSEGSQPAEMIPAYCRSSSMMYLMTLAACTLDLVARWKTSGVGVAETLFSKSRTTASANNRSQGLEPLSPLKLPGRHDCGNVNFEPQQSTRVPIQHSSVQIEPLSKYPPPSHLALTSFIIHHGPLSLLSPHSTPPRPQNALPPRLQPGLLNPLVRRPRSRAPSDPSGRFRARLRRRG